MSAPISNSEVCSAIQECLTLVEYFVQCEADHAYRVVQAVVVYMANRQGMGDLLDPARTERYLAPLDAMIAQVCGIYMLMRFEDRQSFDATKRLWEDHLAA